MSANLVQILRLGVSDVEHIYHSQDERMNFHTADLGNAILHLKVGACGLKKLGQDVNRVCLPRIIGVMYA